MMFYPFTGCSSHNSQVSTLLSGNGMRPERIPRGRILSLTKRFKTKKAWPTIMKHLLSQSTKNYNKWNKNATSLVHTISLFSQNISIMLICSFTLVVEDKTALQNQITTLSASQHSSTSVSTSLKERVEDTEREKRELVGVISRLKDESSQREGKGFHYLNYIHNSQPSIEEIQTLRANLKDARQEHQTLEAQVRELRSIETSTKVNMSFCTRLVMKLNIL